MRAARKSRYAIQEKNWEDYDEFSAGSKLLEPFYDLKVKSLSAINTDVIRVDLDFDEKG